MSNWPDDRHFHYVEGEGWYWVDETWNWGNPTKPCKTKEEAIEEQRRYCIEVLG